MKKAKQNLLKGNKNKLTDYGKYSSIAFQMLVIILLSVFGGFKLDHWLHTTPVFTVILSIVGVFLAVYFAIKDLINFK
ncbi:MAG: AtpZ/AtpI family protein [Bacteroidota bacterium]|nr:AtpZ/AtpI family protein [Bacteroidota bacterium]MDP4225779.1 AtpZ/AtpI family protein [Bacteroidota bacterium]MDP4274673.1 AtpZ/AtpI family protein [Bacteroidota bacterium]